MFFLVVAKNPECNKYMSYNLPYVRNTAVATQTQQGTTFLVLENPTVRHIYVVPEYTIMAAVLNQV